MGKKKAKRVKKAWRNISTQDIDDFNEKATRDANSGGSLASAPSDSIFVLDKSTDAPVKRKIEKHREKVLRYESILQRNPFVQPLPTSVHKKSNKKKEKVNNAQAPSQDVPKDKEDGGSDDGMVDLWSQGIDNSKRKKKAKPSLIPAVEVEPPGCSFNPEDESHKDSLAQAVAEEMKKVYKSELGPQPIPLTIPGEAISEEDRYFLEVDNGDEDEIDEENQTKDADIDAEKRKSKEKRVTKAERNRKMRRKEQLKAEEESKKIEELSKEIESLPDILQEIAQEEEEKQKRHLRRVIAKEERLKSNPPRLGKRKFEPAPVQVLLTDEITGSLRKLKACCTLARDRFKSLEKRGLIVPSAKSGRK
uniref:Ribosome biogenesis protein NOP53 n=1 Tax=Opuntia streptacantha TaxID=393608 RepID=A0A7C9EZJ9_OPUST